MSSLPIEVVEMLGQTIAKVVPVTIALALVFSVLAHFWACNPGKPWWRKKELVTDVCYWFFVPLFARVFPEDLDWISAARFHPVNLVLGTIGVDVVLLLAGISPNIMIWVGPFNIFHSAFVHANLNWTLGPFKYVLATPVFHRWHHTAMAEGGNTNFAGTFPLWDMLFGTWRMPENTLPDNYGIDDQAAFPTEIAGQLAYPFRR
jgi:hypothetical protein